MKQETLQDGSLMIIGTKEEIEKMIKERIEPVKKEPVTVIEYMKKAGHDPGKWCAEDVYSAFKFSEKNRDLLYADLMDLSEKIIGSQITYDKGSMTDMLFCELKKIKEAL